MGLSLCTFLSESQGNRWAGAQVYCYKVSKGLGLWTALGFCGLVIGGVKVSKQSEAFDMVANSHIFHFGTMPPRATATLPNLSEEVADVGGAGPVRARVRRTEEFLS